MGNRKNFLINELVKYCDRMDRREFVANHDGNLSVRYDDMTLLCTPTAESKANINHEMILMLDMDGKKIEGIGKPFSEIKLHLSCYHARDDIQAVVHAHPPFAMARGLVNLPLEINIPEAVVSIGETVPVTDFAMPGDPVNDKIICNMLCQHNIFMMPGNGIIAVGDNIEQAWLRLELAEHLMKIDSYARSIGTPMELNEKNRQELLDKRKTAGLDPSTKKSSKTKKEETKFSPEIESDPLKKLIAEEIKKILGEN